jgi:hypothetical protein
MKKNPFTMNTVSSAAEPPTTNPQKESCPPCTADESTRYAVNPSQPVSATYRAAKRTSPPSASQSRRR